MIGRVRPVPAHPQVSSIAPFTCGEAPARTSIPSSLRGEVVARVPQVVEMHTGNTQPPDRLHPAREFVEVRPPKGAAFRSGERQRICVGVDVHHPVLDDLRAGGACNDDGPRPDSGFRRTDDDPRPTMSARLDTVIPAG
jgi:hypothetical protein